MRYLLFEKSLWRAQITPGYRDTIQHKQEMLEFLALPQRTW
jgi:hypothetical protein